MAAEYKDQCATCSFKDLCRDFIYFNNGAGRHKKCNMYVKSRNIKKGGNHGKS